MSLLNDLCIHDNMWVTKYPFFINNKNISLYQVDMYYYIFYNTIYIFTKTNLPHSFNSIALIDDAGRSFIVKNFRYYGVFIENYNDQYNMYDGDLILI